MSLDYTLKIATELEPAHIMPMLANGLGLTQSDDTSLRGEAVFAVVGRMKPLAQEITEERFGFHATLAIYFELYSDEDEDEGKRIIGRATAALLKHQVGNAVLLFDDEDVLLQRTGGRVVIAEVGGVA